MKKILILICCIGMAACEKGTTVEYEITNRSDKTIEVKFQHNLGGDLQTTSIGPNLSKTVFLFDQQGWFDDNFKCGQFIDSVWILTNDTCIYAGKSLSQGQTWTLSESSNSGGDVKDCGCKIEQNDFN